jgi:hypothetical protein
MATSKVFKSKAPVLGYVFKSGKSVHFLNHIYLTNAKDEIEELTLEADNGHPNFYIDPEMTEIDPIMLDPMAVLRAKIREEERASLLAATNPNNDMGSTQEGKLEGISTSASVAGLMGHSDATSQPLPSTVKVGAIKVASTK